MHLNFHAAIGILISMLFSQYLSNFQINFIIIASMIIDLDFLFSKFAQKHNHRRLITHTFFPYIIIALISILLINITPLWFYIFLFSVCAIIHVCVDLIDWGISPFLPFNKNFVGGILERPNTNETESYWVRRCYYVNRYYGSKIIISIELIFGILAFLSILFFAPNYFEILMIYIFWLVIHLVQFFLCQRKK
ncbi:MAG: metal-dependent hydrolase [Candidatus Helarchaeota archaeon]|nr:metal-dependent hydrolase [Candidatus Helarchaeota archaeon]